MSKPFVAELKIYWKALIGSPPLHPLSFVSQSTSCCSERLRYVPVPLANWPSMAAIDENAQQELLKVLERGHLRDIFSLGKQYINLIYKKWFKKRKLKCEAYLVSNK